MTNLELQLRFEQRFQNHINKNIDLRTIDVEYYLNEGLRRFVEYFYSVYETNEAARKRLNTLVTTYTIDRASASKNTTNAHDNGEFWELPDEMLYVVSEEATINLSSGGTHRAGVKPIKIDFYNKHIKNSFKKPYLDLVWRLDIGNNNKQHEFIVGNGITNVETYFATYIKNPDKIALLSGTPETTSCKISPEFHEEIIDRAVQVAVEVLSLTGRLKTNDENNEN